VHRPLLARLAALLLVLVVAGVVVVKHQDQDNRFCIACHLHERHYRESVATPPANLSAAHFAAATATPAGASAAGPGAPASSGDPASSDDATAQGGAAAPAAVRTGHPERCFTCHSGEGVVGWSQVTLLSAWDAARWVLGDRHEPTAMRLPIENRACLKCHAAQIRGTLHSDETSAYHQLAEHRGVTTACVACHRVHPSAASARLFLEPATVHARCAGCHKRMGES
jgi:predicted CXXCH cytochrome family protein